MTAVVRVTYEPFNLTVGERKDVVTSPCHQMATVICGVKNAGRPFLKAKKRGPARDTFQKGMHQPKHQTILN